MVKRQKARPQGNGLKPKVVLQDEEGNAML
jgi:hypothetical protein